MTFLLNAHALTEATDSDRGICDRLYILCQSSRIVKYSILSLSLMQCWGHCECNLLQHNFTSLHCVRETGRTAEWKVLRCTFSHRSVGRTGACFMGTYPVLSIFRGREEPGLVKFRRDTSPITVFTSWKTKEYIKETTLNLVDNTPLCKSHIIHQ